MPSFLKFVSSKPIAVKLSLQPASWSSGNAFVSGAGDLRFNFGSIKSDIVLPMAGHRCDISSKGAVLPGCNDAEMGPANSVHALAYYSEYNERFDFFVFFVRNRFLW